MPQITFNPTSKKIKTILPGSKSISNRAVMIAAIGNFLPDFKNLSKCDDVKVLVEALHSNTNKFDLKDSGTALRFMIAFAAGIAGEWHLTGSERLQQRPVKPLVDALLAMGANITYDKKGGYAPLTIKGTKMKGGELSIDVSQSSQFASALLLIAPMLEKGLKLKLDNPGASTPYIDLTVKMMEEFGLKIMQYTQEIAILPGQTYTPREYNIEADWSAAAFWYELVALKPDISVKLIGLSQHTFQGDKSVVNVFKKLGVKTSYGTSYISISGFRKTNNEILIIDIAETPDLFPAFVLTCIAQKKPFKVSGIKNLVYKESNRIKSVVSIAEQMGVELSAEENFVMCERFPEEYPERISLSVSGDHRIAMALAPLSVIIPEIETDHPEVVNKSYPEYWKEMQKAGIEIKESY